MSKSNKSTAQTKGDGALRLSELRTLIDLIIRGARLIDQTDLPYEKKYASVRNQIMCFQLICVAPDVIRDQIRRATKTIEAHEKGRK
jgi:hypothetical protein